MLSHKNFVCQIGAFEMFDPNFKIDPNTDSYISYLPLSHCFERCLFTIMMSRGIPYGFYQGDVTKLSQDLQALKPTIMITVPRLLNRFYDVINANLR